MGLFALLLEGCASEHEYRVDGDNHHHDVVRLSKNVIYILRTSPEAKFDSERFASLPHLMTMKTRLATSARLLLAILTNPKARYQIYYLVSRVSGTVRRPLACLTVVSVLLKDIPFAMAWVLDT